MNKSFFTLSLLSMAILTSCGGEQQQSVPLHSVYVVDVQPGEGQSSINLAGLASEANAVSLGFKTAGQIKKIYVHPGQSVRAGQLLAELDDADYRLGVEALQIQYDQTSQEVARAKRMFEAKSLSPNDYEKATAGLRQLGIQLQVNKNKLAYTKLYAPAPGVIGEVNFAPAEMVDAGTAVFSLLNSTPLEIVCDIPASVYHNIDSYTGFSCHTSLDPATVYPLRVLGITPRADGNQLYRLRLSFEGKAPRGITSGANVEVSAQSTLPATGVELPAAALFKRGDEVCVWRVMAADSTVTAIPVTATAAPRGGNVIISTGLAGGDRIVRAGVSALHEGEKVSIIEPASATNVGGLL